MSELGLLYQPQIRAQDFLRAAEQQRLVRIAVGKNRPQLPRLRPQRQSR